MRQRRREGRGAVVRKRQAEGGGCKERRVEAAFDEGDRMLVSARNAKQQREPPSAVLRCFSSSRRSRETRCATLVRHGSASRSGQAQA